MSAVQQLFLLLAAHALCDYPLQGDFLAKAKNKFAPIPGVPWYQAMGAHCLMHAGAVYIITGVWWLAALELVSHFVIDHSKCKGIINFNEDQAMHVACKITWAICALFVTRGAP